MGGNRETYVGSLRMHVNGNVHVHDDSKNVKYEATPIKFKRKVSAALEALGKSDGAYIIDETKEIYFLAIQDKGKLGLLIHRKGSHRGALDNFIKGL